MKSICSEVQFVLLYCTCSALWGLVMFGRLVKRAAVQLLAGLIHCVRKCVCVFVCVCVCVVGSFLALGSSVWWKADPGSASSHPALTTSSNQKHIHEQVSRKTLCNTQTRTHTHRHTHSRATWTDTLTDTLCSVTHRIRQQTFLRTHTHAHTH